MSEIGIARVSSYDLRSVNVRVYVVIYSSTAFRYSLVALLQLVLWSLYAYKESTFFTMLSYLCDTSYSYFKALLYEVVVVPVSSVYC